MQKQLLVLIACILTIQSQWFLKNKVATDKMEEHFKSHSKKDYRVQNEKVQIHLIPHSHDDVGWLKSVDQYFYGYRNDIQQAGVQYTIEGIVTELLLDASKTFVYVEIAFFYRWYKNQDEIMKDKVKMLTENGQLEFINGGACMNDEAAPYYEDMIDQMTWGHQILKAQFNVYPTIGWQIDPFGHSSTQARLFHDMGMDAWFFSRVDYQDKENRLNSNNLEMIVNPVSDAKINKPIFTGVLYYHYEAPPGFNFDVSQNEDPIMFDSSLEYYNLEQKAQQFVDYFKQMASHYKQNIVMHTMGSDFQYMDAKLNFMNMDRLVHYIQENKDKFNVDIQYSTVSKYVQAVNALNITTYQTKTDDFFPYASDASDFWTGYFTSRVNSKFLIKETGRFLHTVRTLLVYFYINQLINDSQYKQAKELVFDLEHNMGICMHHDAISGTEKEAVNQDYSRILVKSRDNLKEFFKELMKDDIHTYLNLDNVDLQFCTQNQTASDCNVFTQDKDVLLVLSSSQDGMLDPVRIIQINVDSAFYDIHSLSKNLQNFQYEIICSDNFDESNCVAYLYVEALSTGYSYFRFTANPDKITVKAQNIQAANYFDIGNYTLTLWDYANFDIYNVDKPNKHYFNIEYLFYKSYQNDGHKSGAYTFRPDKSNADAIAYSQFNRGKIYIGELVTVVSLFRVDQFNNNNIIAQVKFFTGKYNTDNIDLFDVVEISSFVNSIDVSDDQGKEVIIRVTNNQIDNQQTFYTDSNGLEMQQRKLNYRATWDLKQTEEVAGNYYPVNFMIGIYDATDNNKQLFLINDRSQGGSSLSKGQVELMIHRRNLYDDSKGVGEPMNERDLDGKGMRSQMKHYLVNNYHTARKLQYILDFQPLVALATPDIQNLQNYNRVALKNQISNLFPAFTKIHALFDYSGFYTNFYRIQMMDPNVQSFELTFPDESTVDELSLTLTMQKSQMESRRLKWNYDHTYPDNIQQKYNISTLTLLHMEIYNFGIKL